jgi:serine/threonine protein kinase
VATTPAKRACSVCGTLLANDSAYCPVCALQQALGTQTYSDSNSSSELRFEHYTVLQDAEGKPLELGRGGMGVTYKAFDVHLQCPVALKIINAQLFENESARLRFVREARAAASVRHQNVASVFHIGESGGNYYYAMEFVEGETLAALIRRLGRLKTDLALEILEQIAAGLAAIEKQHLVHRDIKPSNIMVSFQGGKLENVKIIDLGLAKGVAEENTLSTVGAFVGTPAYASPEQFAGVATDIRSDLYSLGITLWEMLSGKLPFAGSAAELMYEHQHAEPPIQKLTNVSKPVIAVLQVLLAKDPNQRFQSPAQLQNALPKVRGATGSNSLLTGKELRGTRDQITGQSPKPKLRRYAFWLMAALGSFMLAAFLIYGFREVFLSRRSAETVPTEKSIAVLPFESLSDNRNDSYFADGVQDEILNNLAKIAQLKVISRTSVMQYRGDNKRDLRQIASALGVTNVLEGTVRRDGNHVRVSTELIDARNDNTIWADSYDRDLPNIFEIQSEIAQAVASRLSARLSPEERKNIEEKPTTNLEAYDIYLKANQLVANSIFSGNLQEDLLRAISLLQQAIKIDSKFVLAFCRIAEAVDTLYLNNIDQTSERREIGDAAVNEALRLRPDLPEVQIAAARHLYECYRNYEEARLHLTIAERMLPNASEVLALHADIDRKQGRWEESTRRLKEAVSLDPRNPELLNDLAINYENLRRYRALEETCDRLIQLEPDSHYLKVARAGDSLFWKADLAGYRASLENLPPSIKEDATFASLRIHAAALARDWTAAKEIIGKSSNAELYLFDETGLVPRECLEIWLAALEGQRPTMEVGSAAYDQLKRKIEADPRNSPLLSALSLIDAALGRKQEAILEATHAVEMLPTSEDALDGPMLVSNLAIVYAWTDELDLAFEKLTISVTNPAGVHYGELKLDPAWDPLRKDPRFDKLLAELAPRD